MKQVLLLVAFSVLLPGYATAQQTTGLAASEAKKQVLQIEKDKVAVMLKGGTAFADWLYKMDAEDCLFNSTNYHRSKAEVVALWRSGKIAVFAHNEYDYHVYAYDNGKLVVITYRSTLYQTLNGKSSRVTKMVADSWVRHNGRWLRVVHFSTYPPAFGPKESSD